MANTAIYGNYAFFASPEVGWVAVNGSQDGNGLPATDWVMDLSPSGGTPGYQRASIVASRLNAIFGDTNRDLDFILPMADSGGNYLIGCSLVQRNAGATTYYCGTVSNPSDLQCNGCGCGDGTNSLPTTTVGGFARHSVSQDMHKVYGGTNISPPTANQELIVTVTAADKLDGKYWELALQWANNIRARLNASNALGTPVQQLYSRGIPPTFATKSINQAIVEGPPGDVLCCVSDASGRVYHGQDLNAATSDNSLLGYWVRITSQSSGKSVVARVTDISPKLVEFSNQVYRALWSPPEFSMFTMSNP